MMFEIIGYIVGQIFRCTKVNFRFAMLRHASPCFACMPGPALLVALAVALLQVDSGRVAPESHIASPMIR